MNRTAFWKQAALSVMLLIAAALAWENRTELGAIWASIGSEQSQSAAVVSPTDSGAPVITGHVREMQDNLTFSAIGTGFALKSVTLRAPSTGEIVEFNISPERKFRAGDVLLRLKDTDQRLAVALADARLNQATLEQDRYSRLQDSGIAAAARLEEVQTAFKVASIELEKATADLNDRTLRAPFDGVAGLASFEQGERITEATPVASYDDRSQILVEFDLPEALLSRVSPGQAVSASTPSMDRQQFAGAITAIDSRVDATTRTARVRAAIDNSADRFRPGASFALTLDLPGETYPTVPELALQFSRGALHVWRVKAGAAEQVVVRMVRRRAGHVIVEGPLAPGDVVVVEGTQRLRPGIAVNVLNANEDGST
ncbi:efflux RND transporter periplasmic adaptor subunit [Pseudohalocynthiibacter aestuariivivens]|nr:efflux RND transporter periplasmic adaptor subunit [Pseudohalocynthiibacter aestuariivivens]QIE45008.1 efflux RND transporter periplasmic adaptor subunit [Pseudohalocynthiibacter aestuariivivens]